MNYSHIVATSTSKGSPKVTKKESVDIIELEERQGSPGESSSWSQSAGSPSKSSSSSVVSSYSDTMNPAELKTTHRESRREEQCPLLKGEVIKGHATNVTYLCPYRSEAPKGTITLTNYKLYFRSDKEPLFELEVPLGVVSQMEKRGGFNSTGIHSYAMDIFCKDMRNLRFAHPQEKGSRTQIYELIKTYAFPLSSPSKLPVFAYQLEDNYSSDGWNVFNPLKEYERMGVPNDTWRISKVNDKFDLCDSYPQVFAVPKLVKDEELYKVAEFRSRGRIPVLSWTHRDSQASITRCSQPLVGISLTDKANSYDQTYFERLMETNAQSHKLYIMDARPLVNARANMARGGGYEEAEWYTNAEIQFLDIHNIHVMRESLRKLKEVCLQHVDDNHWLSKVCSTDWLLHIRTILSGAVKIAEKVKNNKTSVVVHCSDGWDRTSQLTSLAKVMLDPFYRTITGFQVLIQHEWISMGHKFKTRIGHGEDKHSDADRSPVFLQFIECVWQITRQFPRAFEFNEHFLVTILDHLFSCRFGTFLCNCEKDQIQEKVRQQTVSLWSLVNSAVEEHKNPSFSGHLHQNVLFPVASMRCLEVWTAYYCRWNPRMTPQESKHIRNRELLVLEQELRRKVNDLTLRLEERKNRANLQPSPPKVASPVSG